MDLRVQKVCKKCCITLLGAELFPPQQENVAQFPGRDATGFGLVASPECTQDFLRDVLPLAMIVHDLEHVGKRDLPICKQVEKVQCQTPQTPCTSFHLFLDHWILIFGKKYVTFQKINDFGSKE